MRIDVATVHMDLKMQMRSGRVAGAANLADGLTLRHRLAAVDQYGTQMGIDRLVGMGSRIVFDDDHITITAAHGAGPNHYTGIRRPHRVTQVTGDIDAQVTWPIVIAGEIMGS